VLRRRRARPRLVRAARDRARRPRATAARSVADRRSRAARTTRGRAARRATLIDASFDSRERRDGDESARGRCVRAREGARERRRDASTTTTTTRKRAVDEIRDDRLISS